MTRARWLVFSMAAAMGTAVLAGSAVSGCEAGSFDDSDGPVIPGPQSPPFNNSGPAGPAPGGRDAGLPGGDGGTLDGGPRGDAGVPPGDAPNPSDARLPTADARLPTADARL